MIELSKIAARFGAALLMLGVLLVGDISAAYAQSASCANLVNTLRTLERNPDFRSYRTRTDQLRTTQRQEQQAESRYIREGCNDDAKARRPLNAQCRALARTITDGRKQVAALQRSVQTGDAIAQQREAVLQEIARFDCGAGSNARVTQTPQRRGNIFEQLFNIFSDSDEDIRGDDFSGYGNYQTVRTVCVRTCDGYYWPVSYSTLPEYIGNDAQQCQSQCPGAEVALYYYDNPGQEAEQMVSVDGQPYRSLPNAFRYRQEFDVGCSCKAPINYGAINITQTAGGQSRAIIQFGEVTFPLPLRDPRREVSVVAAAPVEVAQYVAVPLPRRRPPAPGEEPRPVPVAPVAAAPNARIVKFGDKSVRVVGPDTPYAPTTRAGT